MMGQQNPMANPVPSAAAAVAPAAPPPPPPLPAANGGIKKARSGYNAKAMAEIRKELRAFEDVQPSAAAAVNLISSSGRPVSNAAYNECIQTLVTLGFDEVRMKSRERKLYGPPVSSFA